MGKKLKFEFPPMPTVDPSPRAQELYEIRHSTVRVFPRPVMNLGEVTIGHEIANTTLTRDPHVRIPLPPQAYVIEQIHKAVQAELLENREPRFCLLGFRWWAVIEWGQVRLPMDDEGFYVLDGTMDRGVRVICKTADERDRYLASVKDV